MLENVSYYFEFWLTAEGTGGRAGMLSGEGMVRAVPVPLTTCSDHWITNLSWPGIYDHLLLLLPLGKKHPGSLASLWDGIHLTLGSMKRSGLTLDY